MSEKSVVRFGPTARKDPDSEVRIFAWSEGKLPDAKEGDYTWVLVHRTLVLGKKKLTFDVPDAPKYVVMVIGDKICGVQNIVVKEAPFNVFLDPPEDHSKDYLRMSLPTNLPVSDRMAALIRNALKD